MIENFSKREKLFKTLSFLFCLSLLSISVFAVGPEKPEDYEKEIQIFISHAPLNTSAAEGVIKKRGAVPMLVDNQIRPLPVFVFEKIRFLKGKEIPGDQFPFRYGVNLKPFKEGQKVVFLLQDIQHSGTYEILDMLLAGAPPPEQKKPATPTSSKSARP